MKRCHMNFDDVCKLVNGRPGIRFGRVAWGADLWLEYAEYWGSYNPRWCGNHKGKVNTCPWGAIDIDGQEKRDWVVLQDLETGVIPKL